MSYASGHDAAWQRLTGSACFVDDLHRPGQLFAAFARSPHAHARLLGVEADAALAMPDVVAVYTGADLQAAGVGPLPLVEGFTRGDGTPAASPQRTALAIDRVRFVGEAVAMVVAKSREAACAAAASLPLRFEVLPAVADPLQARQPQAAVLCEGAPDNVSAYARSGDAATVEAAFASAAHQVALSLTDQRLAACTMEPRALLAEIDAADGRLVVHASTQMASTLRDGLAVLLPGLDKTMVRVVVGAVGGGFGMKTVLHPEEVAVCFAALTLRRPVKWQAERIEDFVSAPHARDVQYDAALALNAAGRVLALRVHALANVGAYATMMGVVMPLAVAPLVATSVYDIPCVDLQATAVLTNTAPVGAYRGAGQPETIYVLERLMDAAARHLQLDPAELRRRNLVRPDQMPYRSATGQVYDSGRFEQVLDAALRQAGWVDFEARRATSRRASRLRGRGVVSFLKWTGAFQLDETARLEVAAEGFVELLSTAQEIGQGIADTQRRLAADALALPLSRLRIVQGDTDRGAGFGSGGSRSLFTGGAAVADAAAQLIEVGRVLAAEALEASPADTLYRRGRFEVAGTDLGIGWFELAGHMPDSRIGAGGASRATGPSWPNACQVCEVEIDAETGAVQLERFVSVNDIGHVINLPAAIGQIEGAVVQGIGQALYEQICYDPLRAQLLTGSFMDYALPRADVVGEWLTTFDTSSPCATNTLGAKGAGELGVIGAVPVVVNAVLDALAAAGVHGDALNLQMPLTAERVWRALAARDATRLSPLP